MGGLSEEKHAGSSKWCDTGVLCGRRNKMPSQSQLLRARVCLFLSFPAFLFFVLLDPDRAIYRTERPGVTG